MMDLNILIRTLLPGEISGKSCLMVILSSLKIYFLNCAATNVFIQRCFTMCSDPEITPMTSTPDYEVKTSAEMEEISTEHEKLTTDNDCQA